MADPSKLLFIVDDEITLADSLATVFEIKGFDVETFATAEQALEKIREGSRPHLIIMDGNLPGMSGPEAIEAIREEGYEGDFIGISGEEYEEAMKGAKVKSYWEKPFDIGAFIDAVIA